MQTYTPTTVARQIDQIRREIRSGGFAVVGCEQLDFLCEGRVSEEERTVWLKDIGTWEGWTVERQPDGKVLFSSLLVKADGSFASHPQAA